MRVAISGAGGVGTQLARRLLERSEQYYRERFGVEVRLVGLCGSTAGIVSADGVSLEAVASRNAWQSGLTGARWLDALSADVLFEAGPSNYETGEPGLGYLQSALARGMHGIAISKGALVLQGAELQRIADEHGGKLYAGAAGAAGMPMIDFLSYDLAGTEVRRVEAVLTGTAAFVLDRAVRHGIPLESALAEAQELGIAESDASFDLDGWDTAAKLVIIAGMTFGRWITLESISRESVRQITEAQLESWRASGAKVALVGELERRGSDIIGRVRLQTFEPGHAYSSSTGSEKAAFIHTEDLGDYAIIGGASSVQATVAAAVKDFEHLLRDTR